MARRLQRGISGAALGFFLLIGLCCGLPLAITGRKLTQGPRSQQTQWSSSPRQGSEPDDSLSPTAPASVAKSGLVDPARPKDDPAPPKDDSVEPAAARTVETAQRTFAPIETTLLGSDFGRRDHRYRDWTSKDGKHKVQARLIGYWDGRAILITKNADQVRVDPRLLSHEDNEFLAESLRMNEEATVVIGKISTVLGNGLSFVDLDGNSFTVKLAGIAVSATDADDYSADCVAWLEHHVEGKEGWIEWQKKDSTGSLLATVYINGVNVNLHLVGEGLVRHEAESAGDLRLANAEYVARMKQRGIWARQSD